MQRHLHGIREIVYRRRAPGRRERRTSPRVRILTAAGRDGASRRKFLAQASKTGAGPVSRHSGKSFLSISIPQLDSLA
jgi:hypothetical protein